MSLSHDPAHHYSSAYSRAGDAPYFLGLPTGMTQMGHTIYIYWQARFAMVYTRSLRPTRRVDFIVYDRDPEAAFPWRGFTSHNH